MFHYDPKIQTSRHPYIREEILQLMRTFTGGRNTVPQIFFNSEHLGDNDDVKMLRSEGNGT
jgi:glutaredoxin